MDPAAVGALRAIPMRCTTVGDLMPVLATGAYPGMNAELLFCSEVTHTVVAAIRTVPITGMTGFFVSMSRSVFFTSPAVCAVLVFVITFPFTVIAVFTPPMMRTTVGFRVPSDTFVAEPTAVRARIRRRMEDFFRRTVPEMRTGLVFRNDSFAIPTAHGTAFAEFGQ